jgi:NAD(P)-dependent dehydrogenase (short-subunit alcohol dehydrogenase family)
MNPDYDFSAKVALVVGASIGIGLVLCSLMRPI